MTVSPRFYTFRRSVPRPKPGQVVDFLKGRGYYLRRKKQPRRVPAVHAVPAAASVFAGKGAFSTTDARSLSGLRCDWFAWQLDPEGDQSPVLNNPGRMCWWQARPTQAVVDEAARRGVPFIAQAENGVELARCLALDTRGLVAKALIGNLGGLDTTKALEQRWDYISEWYWNAHPWEQEPTGHDYPRFVNVCFGIYSEAGVPQIPLADYLKVWHGSYSVWKSEALTEADRKAFNAA